MSDIDLKAAHRHSSHNRAEIEASDQCGCFYCGKVFPPTQIREWIDIADARGQWTARCPGCGIDSVLGDASGLPIAPDILRAMHERWFERTLPHSEVIRRFGEKK